MKTLVTGGSGYFGELVVERLRQRGDDVRVFDLVDNSERNPEVEFIRADVRDRQAVRAALKGVEVVHHSVAQVPLAKDKPGFWSVNVTGTRIVLEEALRAGVRKVVLVSSSAVYGVPSANPVTLATQPRPQEAYGRAKLEGERMAEDFVRRGLGVSVIRPRTILGRGRLGIFALLFEWIRKGRPIYVLGDGRNRYQFVHPNDLATVCLQADRRNESETFLAGTDRFGTMRELLEGLIEHAGTGSTLRSLPLRAAQLGMQVIGRVGLSPLGDYHALMYGREMFFDISATQEVLGWKPKHGNHDMICESYDWYATHRNEVRARRVASPHRAPVKAGVLKVLDWLP